MGILADILPILLTIGGVILVHELGHFLVARWMGIYVVEFSIGFGPRLFVFKGKKTHPHLPPTEYAIALLPVGGFVKMLGYDPGDPVPDEAKDVAFGQKPIWRRFLAVAAGPAFNLILPLILFFAVSLTVSKVDGNVVADVIDGYPAAAAGIRAGDRITEIDGEKIEYWWQIQAALQPRYEQPTHIAWIDVTGQPKEATLTPALEERVYIPDVITKKVGIIGLTGSYALPIVGVTTGSAAAAAGIAPWDRVVAVDGTPVTRVKQMLTLLTSHADRDVRVSFIHYDAAVVRPFGVDAGTVKDVTLPAAVNDPARGLVASACVVWRTVPGSPAERIGLKPGDEIVSLGDHSCDSWMTFADSQKGKGPMKLVVKRDGVVLAPMALEVVRMPWPNDFDKTAKEWIHGIVTQFDVAADEKVDNDDRLAFALYNTSHGFGESIEQTLKMLGGLFAGKVSIGEGLGGPVDIGRMAVRAAEQGWDQLLRLIGAISISIGLVNLLPIPILDGGQILFLALEGIRRRPVSLRTRMIAVYTSLAFVVVLMVLVIRNGVAKFAG
ncbi:MAG: site-2 protease family protein [Myxococcota bacterium]